MRDAATVMLVRDADEPRGSRLQVLMQRRNPRAEFVGGAHVFPGGALDPDDRDAHRHPECAGRLDSEASATLGVGHGGLAYWVAAIRECFEEAGVLLARHASSGAVVDFSDPVVARRFEGHRSDVDAGRRSLVEAARRERLVLDVASAYYFAHWITPVGAPRRYDTRFFVAAAPPAQTPSPDDREAVESRWIAPLDALARFERGEMELIFPTLKSLEAMARFDTAAELLDATRLVDELPAVAPKLVQDPHGVRIVLPGDEGHVSALGAGESVASTRTERRDVEVANRG